MKTKLRPTQLASIATKAMQERRYPDARKAFDRLLRAVPENPRVKLASAACDVARDAPAEAIPVLRDLLREYPAWPDPWELLGAAYKKLEAWDDAAVAYRRTFAFAPSRVTPLVQYAGVRASVGDVAEAASVYRQAAAMPVPDDDPGERFNRGCARLLLGLYVEGFADYEAREAARLVRAEHSKAPTWDGRPTEGKVALLQEQGFGDTLQFLRFVPDVAERSGGVLLAVPRPLVALCRAQNWPNVRVVEEWASTYDGEDDAHAFRLLPMSIPAVFGAATVLRRDAYLRAPTLAILPPKTAPTRIAFAWKGNPAQGDNRTRSIPLSEFAYVFRTPHVEWVSVQVGTTEEERAILLGAGVRNLEPVLTDFARTASVLEESDLVVSVCTSVVHLAGALGRPTYLLKSATPEWRWGLVGDRSLWYDSVRIRRQERVHAWGPVLASLVGNRGLYA